MIPYLPIFAEQFQRQLKLLKIKYYGIYTKGTRKPKHYTEIRFVPKEMASPVATEIYSDRVFISIWEPSMIAIVIKSKNVTENYKKHFKLLWRVAKTFPT